MIKGLTGSHESPQVSSLKKVGDLLDVAIPGTLNLNSDLDVSVSYQKYYNMLTEADRQKLINQSQEYLAKMRKVYMPND